MTQNLTDNAGLAEERYNLPVYPVLIIMQGGGTAERVREAARQLRQTEALLEFTTVEELHHWLQQQHET